MTTHERSDGTTFAELRRDLLAHAYRMLGDWQRAEDVVQEVWIRWSTRNVAVEHPKAFLLKICTRLCLNELGAAHVRREEQRAELPDPIDLDATGLSQLESLDKLSIAFLVLLQRLTPLERAVILLHDVFDYSHSEIARFLGKTDMATRQALRRAKTELSAPKRSLDVSEEDHRRLLRAFVDASIQGDRAQLLTLLSADASLVVDAGRTPKRFGRTRNLPGPLHGALKIASFVASVTPKGASAASLRECKVNGELAIAVLDGSRVESVLSIGSREGKITTIFIHADPARLTNLVIS